MMNEMESAKRKIVETMTSTERWGPRLCIKQDTKSSTKRQPMDNSVAVAALLTYRHGRG